MIGQGPEVDRRTVLTGAGIIALAPVAGYTYAANEGMSADVVDALARFRSSIPSNFDHDYVENAVVPFFLEQRLSRANGPVLPMIDLPLTKENALPFDLWGLIYKEWRPTPEEGVTVFLQGLENRGDDNLRKRIYFSAVTPDLYGPKFQTKVVNFFDRLLAPEFAEKPFMRHYLDYYWDIYWDLHLGVKGDAIPAGVRQIGESFNTVLAYRNPTRQIVFENYMKVRELLDPLKEWIDEKVKDSRERAHSRRRQDHRLVLAQERRQWGAFRPKDIVFECFHNFVALSQWGNTIFGIMSRLSRTRRRRRGAGVVLQDDERRSR